MRRDLIIGLFVSLAIHGGVAWFGQLTKHGPEKAKPVVEEKIIQLEMPKIEPDEPEKVESDEAPTPLDIAPPMQQDMPQLVQVDSFVQPIQPPPPEGLKPMQGAIVIPQGNHGLGKGIEVFD
ncbi:MAG: energy transducer TonB, partial [Opitutae bacterium]